MPFKGKVKRNFTVCLSNLLDIDINSTKSSNINKYVFRIKTGAFKNKNGHPKHNKTVKSIKELIPILGELFLCNDDMDINDSINYNTLISNQPSTYLPMLPICEGLTKYGLKLGEMPATYGAYLIKMHQIGNNNGNGMDIESDAETNIRGLYVCLF